MDNFTDLLAKEKEKEFIKKLECELDSLHYAYNELNSQNEEVIKLNKKYIKVIDLLVDFLDLEVDIENSNLSTVLGTIYFFSEDNSLIDDLILLKEVLSYYE